VRPHLEVLLRVLIDERGAHDGIALDARRQRHRSRHLRTGALGSLDDLHRRLIEDLVIVRLETDTDFLARLLCSDHVVPLSCPVGGYLMIAVTTPAPTVRPPSRMAKRSPGSIATGTISSTSIWMLSPGITISTPAGSPMLPVTSVVRM